MPVPGGEKALPGYDRGVSSNNDFSGAGQGGKTVILEAGEEVNGLVYHDFDTPVPPQVLRNPGVSQGTPSSESRKQEYRKITEERELREVPKSRKDLKKKKKENPKAKNGDSQR